MLSFGVLSMRDGGRRRAGKTHWAGYFLDVGAGAFAGIFLTAPAFALYLSARSNGMADLGRVSELRGAVVEGVCGCCTVGVGVSKIQVAEFITGIIRSEGDVSV